MNLETDYQEHSKQLDDAKAQLELQRVELLKREGHAANYRKLLEDAMRSVSQKRDHVNTLAASVERMTIENLELRVRLEKQQETTEFVQQG